LLGIYLDKLTILKAAEDSVTDFVHTVLGAMEVISGMLIGLPAFTTSFCLLELYHLMVSCLFGNERLSKAKLEKTRGFGLNEEFFSQDLSLSALGLKLAFPFSLQFCNHFSGEKRKQSLGFIFACLYYWELQNLSTEGRSTDLVSKLIGLVQSNLATLSEERNTQIEYSSVSLKQYVDLYCRKYRRNNIKCSAAMIFFEVYTRSQELQEALTVTQNELCIASSGNFCMFASRNINGALAALKLWLKKLHFEELTSLWFQYAIKKATLAERDTIGLSTIDQLLTLGCRDAMAKHGCDVLSAFLEPDTVARY
jgi:hypothetical protein